MSEHQIWQVSSFGSDQSLELSRPVSMLGLGPEHSFLIFARTRWEMKACRLVWLRPASFQTLGSYHDS